MANKKNEIKRVKMPKSVAEFRCIDDDVFTKQFLDLNDIVLSQIHEGNDDPGKLLYTINVNEYKSKFGLKDEENVFRKLRNAAEKTNISYMISIYCDNGDLLKIAPIQAIRYKANETEIEVELGRQYKMLLCELLGEHRSNVFFALTDTLSMKSKYSKKLYPILLERKGKDKIYFKGNGTLYNKRFNTIIPLQEFRDLLGLNEKYHTSHLSVICDTIADEICSKTKLLASYEFNYDTGRGRGGRVLTHICWNVEPKVIINEDEIQNEITTSEKAAEITKISPQQSRELCNIARKHGLTDDDFLILCRCGVEKAEHKDNPDSIYMIIEFLIKNNMARSLIDDFKRRVEVDFS